MLTRNEAERFLPSALEQWASFADAIAVLDNGEDNTSQLIGEHFSEYHYERYPGPVWGEEAPARARLWEMAVESGADWILVLDSDMIPARDPRDLLHSSHRSIAFNLYDLWSEDEYRTDGLWKAHENWRVWMVRNPGSAGGWEWSERGIHCGHLPWNLDLGRTLFAPSDYGLLHYGYLRNEDRERKYRQYAEQAEQLSEREMRHAESILEPAELRSLPFEPEYRLIHETS